MYNTTDKKKWEEAEEARKKAEERAEKAEAEAKKRGGTGKKIRWDLLTPEEQEAAKTAFTSLKQLAKKASDAEIESGGFETGIFF